jgi:hypothetical protein
MANGQTIGKLRLPLPPGNSIGTPDPSVIHLEMAGGESVLA